MDSAYLDGSYQSNNPSWHIEDSPWKARQISTMLKKHGINPESICEVGCGTGEILVQLLPSFPDALFCGYEVSPQAYDICKRRQSNTNITAAHVFHAAMLNQSAHGLLFPNRRT